MHLREFGAFFVSDWLVWSRVYAECSEQRECCACFPSNRLVSILCLFCVELVGLGTGQTRAFWAKGILCLFCFKLVGLLYFLVNESAFFGCELCIFYNCHVQECKTSELGRIVGILVVHRCVSDLT